MLAQMVLKIDAFDHGDQSGTEVVEPASGEVASRDVGG